MTRSLYTQERFQAYCESKGLTPEHLDKMGLHNVTEEDVRWLGLEHHMDDNGDLPIEAFDLASEEALNIGLGMLYTWIEEVQRLAVLPGQEREEERDADGFGESEFKGHCEDSKRTVEKWRRQAIPGLSAYDHLQEPSV